MPISVTGVPNGLDMPTKLLALSELLTFHHEIEEGSAECTRIGARRINCEIPNQAMFVPRTTPKSDGISEGTTSSRDAWLAGA
jgi:hypothetical protein